MTQVGDRKSPLPDESLDALMRAAFGEAATPSVSPADEGRRGESVEGGALPRNHASYRIVGEIARGGMGVVLRGRDEELARDVAVKVLRSELRDDETIVRRFVEEAQIAGQLQHPGIVPIYELGKTADDRPYFAMKWIRGRTLAELLAERSSSADDRHRFIAIFEHICQAIAYAHSRRVVHRDLKPSNVMIGSFGEVQVLDWGIAKLLGSSESSRSHATPVAVQTTIETIRSRGKSSAADSVVGQVMGTPAYMPPEQARGEIEKVDERSDVFSLGGILCEILTGRATYLGDSAVARAAATSGAVGDAYARLDAVLDAPELVAICKHCLAPDANARPRDARELARAMSEYSARVEERFRAAQIEVANAKVKEQEARKARRLTLALATTFLLLIVTGVGARLWMQHTDLERRTRIAERANAALDRASLAYGRAISTTDPSAWQAAIAEVQRAQSVLDSGEHATDLDDRTRTLTAQIQSGARDATVRVDRERSNQRLLQRFQELRVPENLHPLENDWRQIDASYRAATASEGLDVDARTTEELATSIRERGITEELANALDDWMNACRRAELGDRAERLVALANAIQPDPTRMRFRSVLAAAKSDELVAFAHDVDLHRLRVPTLTLLANALDQVSATADEERVLRTAIELEPGDAVANTYLARAVWYRDYKEAARYFAAALAASPTSSTIIDDYGWMLDHFLGESARAAAMYRNNLAAHPQDATMRLYLGHALMNLGKFDEAIEAYSDALRIEPGREAARIRRLQCRVELHQYDAALRDGREQLASGSYRGEAHFYIGEALAAKGDITSAIVEYRASGIIPGMERLHAVLEELGDVDGSIQAARDALVAAPDHVIGQFDAGLAFADWIDVDAAIAARRAVVRANPESPTQRAWLGVLLREKGLYTESSFELEAADELGSELNRWVAPSDDGYTEAKRLIFRERRSRAWVAEADRLARFEARFERVLHGDDTPADRHEWAEFARLAARRGRELDAAKLYAKAFEHVEVTPNDPLGDRWVDAAIAAATVGLATDSGEAKLEPAERFAWRERALEWLRADSKRLSALIASSALADRVRAVRDIGRWHCAAALKPVREANALGSLDAGERSRWTEAWSALNSAEATLRAAAQRSK